MSRQRAPFTSGQGISSMVERWSASPGVATSGVIWMVWYHLGTDATFSSISCGLTSPLLRPLPKPRAVHLPGRARRSEVTAVEDEANRPRVPDRQVDRFRPGEGFRLAGRE